jgi:hypothetical protein
MTITLADYPATAQTVAPAPTTPAPTESAQAQKAATTRSVPSTPPAGATRAAKPAVALADWETVGLASGAVGLSLLAFAELWLRRRRRVQHGRHR